MVTTSKLNTTHNGILDLMKTMFYYWIIVENKVQTNIKVCIRLFPIFLLFIQVQTNIKVQINPYPEFSPLLTPHSLSLTDSSWRFPSFARCAAAAAPGRLPVNFSATVCYPLRSSPPRHSIHVAPPQVAAPNPPCG
jgi:hypothetical protein